MDTEPGAVSGAGSGAGACRLSLDVIWRRGRKREEGMRGEGAGGYIARELAARLGWEKYGGDVRERPERASRGKSSLGSARRGQVEGVHDGGVPGEGKSRTSRRGWSGRDKFEGSGIGSYSA